MVPTDLSLIIPVFNEEGNIKALFDEINKNIRTGAIKNFELLFVDDGSTDHSWGIIQSLREKHAWIKAIRLSRNFGHDNAMKAGIDNCSGDYAICMDADLQHPPELIPEIYQCFKETGASIIFMQRTFNKDTNAFQGLNRKIYYRMFRWLTHLDIREGVSDFFAVDRKVINVLKKLNEHVYFNRGILFSIGFKREFMPYEANERFSGKTSYTLRKLASLLVSGIVNFTYFPLKIVVAIGLVISGLSFLYGFYAIIKTLIFGSIDGWTSIVTTLSFLNGFIILVLSIIIEYFIVVFKEVKGRPMYIIDEQN